MFVRGSASDPTFVIDLDLTKNVRLYEKNIKRDNG